MDRKRSASFALDQTPTQSRPGNPPDNAQSHEPDGSGHSATPGDVIGETQTSDRLRRLLDHLPQSQQPQSGAAAAPDDSQVINQKSEQIQQQEQDLGDVEQRRAMELLRSMDDDADSGGKVIVCSAPDAGGEKGDLGTCVVPLSDALPDGQQCLAHRTRGSEGEGSTETPDAADSAIRPSTARATAPVVNVANLNTDDSYIAELTMRAQESEREDVLKVTGSTSSNTNK